MLVFFVLLYVVVALLNYSVVQSVVGSVASDHFSSEWGGKVRIGSLGCNPMNHLVLRNVELIAPGNDTVCIAHKMAFRFDGFPYDSHGLRFSRAELKDVFYHLDIDSVGINLDFIIKYYASKKVEEEEKEEGQEFKVLVDDLILDNVCYRQDLKDFRSEEERQWDVASLERDLHPVDVKHMEYRNINARFRNVRVDLDRVTCRIDKFGATERSGLHVKELRGNVYATQSGISVTNLFLETEDSKLVGDVLLDYRHWESMGDFLDSVFFTVHFEDGSYGGMQDAAFWAQALWGMDEQVYLQGDFSGPISDFRADNVKIAFGDESTIDLDAYIYGLPNIDTTIIGAEIHHLHTTYADLAAVRHPAKVKMQAEKIVKSLNNIDLEATFTGTIYDFYTTFSLMCDQGDLQGDVLLAMAPKKKEYRYTGQISSKGFRVGRIAPNEWLSRGGFDLSFEGNGFDPKTMNASAEGQLHHLVVKGQRIMGEMAIDADATGGLLSLDGSLDDVLASLSIHGEGDWRGDYPVYRANVDVQHLDLARFELWNAEDSVAKLSFQASARYSEPDDANSSARVAFSDVHLLTCGREHSMTDNPTRYRNIVLHNLTLASRKQNHWMNTTLRSDLADATLRGYYEYSTLPVLLSHIVDNYLPQSIVEGMNAPQKEKVDGRFEFNLEWKDSASLIRSFVPQLGIARGSTIQANYNYADGFKPIVRSDSLSWGNICFYDVGISAEAVADHYYLQMKSDRLMLGRLQLMDYGTLRIETSRSGMMCRLLWQNGSKSVGGGDMSLRLVTDSNLLRLVVDPSHLAIGGRDWRFVGEGDNYIRPRPRVSPVDNNVSESPKVAIHVDRLGVVSDNQELMLMAYTGIEEDENEEDCIEVQLSNLDLEVCNPFFANIGLILGGQVDGVITQSHVTTGELHVEDFLFNGETLGDIVVNSYLDESLERLNIHAQSKASLLKKSQDFNILIDGYSSLAKDDGELHIDAAVDNLGLAVIEPFVRNFSSNVDGKLSADIALRGKVDSPTVTGSLAIRDGIMNIDFLNVPFGFADTLLFDENTVHINDFVVRDPNGGIAHVNGTVEHHNFDNIALRLSIRSEQLLCMNTSSKDNESFYGRIVASLDGRVRGQVENLDIVLNARTLQGSTLNVPINDKRQLEQVDYIHFVSDDYSDIEEVNGFDNWEMDNGVVGMDDGTSESRYKLTINVEATPDLQFHMPMEFSSLKVDVKARGNGDLQMSLGTGLGFGLAGDYEINNGMLLLDLFGAVSKEFAIDDGSSITLPGNVQGAMFDIRAVLSQRVNLSSLTGSLSGTDSQKPVQVENVIALSGTLASPNVSFDIRLPGADQSVQEEVFSYIDRNNERDMLNQTVSLLVAKRFYNASMGNGADGDNSTSNQAYGLVMGTLGSVISDMVQVVDVNFDYQSGNGLTTDQYAVDISKEWNKFYFESTFGFGGESREVATSGQGTNNMTGDMLVGYKINPRLHFFVFNRSNTNDYTRSDLPYKQGIGLKYTRDFDRIKDFFFWRKENKKP